jgi:hypothetical protein
MTKARDISKLLSTANGKIAGANLDVSFENISDSGTAGTKIASGTTNQRGSTAGQLRYNTSLARFEATTNGSSFLGFASPPTITSISPSILNSAGGDTVIITGTNFVLGSSSVTLNNIAPSTVTVDSTTQITITGTPALNAQTYTNGLVVIADGASATFTFSTSGVPAFTTASGSLGSFNEQTSVGTLIGGTDVGTSHTISSGSLPSGVSINSANGNITGTLGANTNAVQPPENTSGDVTSNFTVLATDAENQTSSRNFSIRNKQGDPLWTSTIAVINDESTITTNSAYNSRTITNRGGITLNSSVKQFGANSYFANGSSDLRVTVNSSENMANVSNICFEGWFYLTQNNATRAYGVTMSYLNPAFFGTEQVYFSTMIDNQNRVGIYQYTGNETYSGLFSETGNVTTGNWFHVAFQATPSVFKYWKNGIYCGAVTRYANDGGTPNNYEIFSSNNTNKFQGYGEEFRITLAERYTGTSNFSAPTETIRKFAT